MDAYEYNDFDNPIETDEYDFGGYIKLSRKLLKWGWFTDANTLLVWIYLLLSANYSDSVYLGMQIPRGGCLRSLDAIANDTKLSKQCVRTAINHLKSTQELTQLKSGRNTIYIIANWDKYQGKLTQLSTQCQHNANTMPTQYKKDNNYNNFKKDNNTPPYPPQKTTPARPTFEEVEEEVRAKGYVISAYEFFEFCDSLGWQINGEPIRAWKALLKKKNAEREEADRHKPSYRLDEFGRRPVPTNTKRGT